MKKKNIKQKPIKIARLSKFSIWVFWYFVAIVVFLALYLACANVGLVDKYVQYAGQSNNFWNYFNFAAIFVVVIVYGILSLYNLFSHMSQEDSRFHCLPIIFTPLFLILENALAHCLPKRLIEDNYYSLLMGLFSTSALAIVTFASLKFSFEISTRRQRFLDTSKIKPDFELNIKNDDYIIDIARNECYLCGIFIGQIRKHRYIDYKTTGSYFKLDKLIYPNRKKLYNIGGSVIDLKFFDLDSKRLNELSAENEVYFMFRDKVNYFYFVQVPRKSVTYNVIGASEIAVDRLIYLFNKRIKKQKTDPVIYTSMDWFRIPYNFYPKKMDL